MRQRNPQNNTSLLYSSTAVPAAIQADSSDDSESDPEDNALVVQEEDDGLMASSSFRRQFERSLSGGLTTTHTQLWQPLVQGLSQGTVWWAQCTTISVAAVLTYSFALTENVQVAIMVVLTLFGAAPMAPAHFVPAALGGFVGGHNSMFNPPHDTSTTWQACLWVIALSWLVGCLWAFGFAKYKVLEGYSGRLGTTTFVGMNWIMVTLWGPLGVVDWNKYYYGFVGVVPWAEEDQSPQSKGQHSTKLATAWDWTEQAEVAIGYVLAVIWLGVVAGQTRLYLVKSQNTFNGSKNNTLMVPILWALLSILCVNAFQYKHAAGLYNGFAVGAYVAMASRLTCTSKLITVSLVAALWGLTLTPWFVGFAGKSGFTAMIGHVTHDAFEMIWLRVKQTFPQAHQASPVAVELQQQQQQPLVPQQPQQQQQQLVQTEEDEPPLPTFKPKPDQAFLTKQQRRQQQRLQHMQRQQQQQQQPNATQPPIPQVEPASPNRLHHRAWSTLPHSEAPWQHPRVHGPSVLSTNPLELEV